MKDTTIALVGTGVVGERIIKQAIAHPAYKIVAIYDENKARLNAMAEQYSLEAAASLEELLDAGADWVYIGTPPSSHATLAQKIASRNLNVLSEKPLAHDAEDGKLMVEAVKEAGVLSAMHFPMMYGEAVNDVKNMLAKGELGDILRVELQCYFPHWPRPWQQNQWIASRAQGGFIREIFPHYLQLMNHYFGDVKISSHQTIYPQDETICETGVMAIGYVGSTIPLLLNAHAHIGQEERIDFKIFGSEKVVSIRNWSELWIAEKDKPLEKVIPSSTPINLLEACYQKLQGNDQVVVVDFEEGLKVQMWIDELLQ